MNLFSKHKDKHAIWLEYNGDKNDNRVPDPEEIGIHNLWGGGDFRSPECIDLLKQSDIVVTNPPFSLFREYVSQLVKYKKKFIILGSLGAISYKEIFKLLKENKVWLGRRSGVMTFRIPDHYQLKNISYVEDESGQKWKSFGNICWYTNLKIDQQNKTKI